MNKKVLICGSGFSQGLKFNNLKNEISLEINEVNPNDFRDGKTLRRERRKLNRKNNKK